MEDYNHYLTSISGMKMLQGLGEKRRHTLCNGIHINVVCSDDSKKVQCISGTYLSVAS